MKEVTINHPAHVHLQREQAETVRSAVRRLPGKYRDAVVLKYLEELPTREILDILKINETAFYTRLNRGRNLLQQDLAEYLENENG
ncbi:MAG: sigma factor-like helix-turn-helix DNA-binding protein [Planctomycetota bacterium]